MPRARNYLSIAVDPGGRRKHREYHQHERPPRVGLDGGETGRVPRRFLHAADCLQSAGVDLYYNNCRSKRGQIIEKNDRERCNVCVPYSYLPTPSTAFASNIVVLYQVRGNPFQCHSPPLSLCSTLISHTKRPRCSFYEIYYAPSSLFEVPRTGPPLWLGTLAATGRRAGLSRDLTAVQSVGSVLSHHPESCLSPRDS